MTRDYEITYILNQESDSKVDQIIVENGGRVLSGKSLGRKKFTYPINKETAGFYHVLRFQLDPQYQSQLDKALKSLKGLIRYLIVNLPTQKLPALDLDEEQKLKEAKEMRREIAQKTPVKVDEKERAKKLDQELEKLLGKTTSDNQ